MNIDDNKLDLPFPFLDSLNKQAFRQAKCNGNLHTFEILTDRLRFPPFEMRVTACTGAVCDWELYDTSDNLISDLDAEYNICDFFDYDIDGDELIIQYNGLLDFAAQLPLGQYYIKASLGDGGLDHDYDCGTFYSEIVTICPCSAMLEDGEVTNYCQDTIQLEYSNSCDIGDIYYAGTWTGPRIIFQNKIDLTKPEYEVVKVATPLDGYLNIEKVTTKKKYKFTFYAPEFMANAMNLLPSHDTIYITDKFGDEAVVKEINVNANPASHCYFKIDVELYIDPENSTNCCA